MNVMLVVVNIFVTLHNMVKLLRFFKLHSICLSNGN